MRKKRLNCKSAFIEGLLASEAEEHRTAAEKLTLLDLLFKRKTFTAEQTFEADAMGVLLGDVLCQTLGLEWVTIEDEEKHSTSRSLSRCDAVHVSPVDGSQANPKRRRR